MENFAKLSIKSTSANESFARSVAAAFASQLDPTIEELADIKTAVSEAVTNSIIHGYEGGDGVIEIEMKLQGDTFTICICDKGRGIEDVTLAMRPLYTSKAHLERSGMGFTVMESFMDTLDVSSKAGSGTSVTMSKTISR